MKYTIWQNFKRTYQTPGWPADRWRGWAVTRHVNLSPIEAETQLVEIQGKEEGLRARYPGTEAIYEVRARYETG